MYEPLLCFSSTCNAVPAAVKRALRRVASYHIPLRNHFNASFGQRGKQKNEEAARPDASVVG